MFGEPFHTTLDNATIGYRKAWMLDNYVLGHGNQIRSVYSVILCNAFVPTIYIHIYIYIYYMYIYIYIYVYIYTASECEPRASRIYLQTTQNYCIKS